jgi:hypothetical protein
MEPVTFPAANYLDTRCGDLPAWNGLAAWGLALVVTEWQPTPAERAAISAGEPVVLWVGVKELPPVALTVGDPCRPGDGPATLTVNDLGALRVLRQAIREREAR